MATPAESAWKRVGEQLEQRRVQMHPRYSNLSLFARERGINYRLAWDVEQGARTNYRRPTLRAIEVAYQLVPGALDTALAGGELRVQRETQPADDDRPAVVREHWGDPMVRELWAIEYPKLWVKEDWVRSYLNDRDAGTASPVRRRA